MGALGQVIEKTIFVCLVDALKVGGAMRSWTFIDALIIRTALRPRHLLVTNLAAKIDSSETTNQESSIWRRAQKYQIVQLFWLK